jgi:hypothetical protein
MFATAKDLKKLDPIGYNFFCKFANDCSSNRIIGDDLKIL